MRRLIYLAILFLGMMKTNVIAQDQPIFTLGEKAKNVNHTGDVWIRELNSANATINS